MIFVILQKKKVRNKILTSLSIIKTLVFQRFLRSFWLIASSDTLHFFSCLVVLDRYLSAFDFAFSEGDEGLSRKDIG